MTILTCCADISKGKEQSKGTKAQNELSHGDHLSIHFGHHVVNLSIGQMSSIRRIEFSHLLLFFVEIAFVGCIVHLGDGRKADLTRIAIAVVLLLGWVVGALVASRGRRNHDPFCGRKIDKQTKVLLGSGF